MGGRGPKCEKIDYVVHMCMPPSDIFLRFATNAQKNNLIYFLGTSNWSADYFVNTGGIGFVFKNTQKDDTYLHQQLKNVFDRDWQSSYAHTIDSD